MKLQNQLGDIFSNSVLELFSFSNEDLRDTRNLGYLISNRLTILTSNKSSHITELRRSGNGSEERSIKLPVAVFRNGEDIPRTRRKETRRRRRERNSSARGCLHTNTRDTRQHGCKRERERENKGKEKVGGLQ